MPPKRRAAPGPSVSESDIRRTFAAIATCVEGGGSLSAVTAKLKAAWSQCDQSAASQSHDTKQRLSNVQQALETWQRVWARLGSQPEFRAAVIRESRLWAKTLS